VETDVQPYADRAQGVVVEKSERFLPRTTKERAPLEDDEESDAEEDVPEDVKVLPQIASFDRFTVWAHEAAPATAEDPYVKGVEEWMAFAQAVSWDNAVQTWFSMLMCHEDEFLRGQDYYDITGHQE